MRKSLIKGLHYWQQWATAKQGSEKERGLTLIEMLAVVVILGIVAAIAIPAVSTAIAQAKVTANESTLGTLQSALTRYKWDNGSYPANLSDLGSRSPTQPLATTASTTTPSTLSTSYIIPTTWKGPYIQNTFPLADSWGNDIWYVPLQSVASGPITGYLLLSGDGPALSVPPTSPPSGSADLDLGGTEYTNTASLIYAAGGSASYAKITYDSNGYSYTTNPVVPLGVAPAQGILPTNLYSVLKANPTSPPVPVND